MAHAASLDSGEVEVEFFPPQSDQRVLGRGEANGSYRVLEEGLARQTALAASRAEEIQALGEALVLAEQYERSRLAADLHDYLAQILVACHMKLALGIRRAGGETELLKEAADLVTQSLAYTRTLVTELNPAVLCESGLGAAIRWLAEQMSRLNLDVEVHEEGVDFPLPEQHAILLFRSVRELLYNVLKHAAVTTATVSIHRSGTALSISVEDRGRGCGPRSAEPTRGRSRSFGLDSVRQRLTAIGGEFEITSSSHGGTRATIRMALPRMQQAGDEP